MSGEIIFFKNTGQTSEIPDRFINFTTITTLADQYLINNFENPASKYYNYDLLKHCIKTSVLNIKMSVIRNPNDDSGSSVNSNMLAVLNNSKLLVKYK
jgi:hypothetical protein